MNNISKEYIKELDCNLFVDKTEKFKTSLVRLTFYFTKDEIDIDALNLLSILITDGCEDYPSTPQLSTYLEELYGSAITPKIAISGDMITYSLTGAFISDFYSQTNLSEKIIELMSKLIYKPNFKNGRFVKAYFDFEKNKLISLQKKSIERKESYSAMRFNALLEKECGIVTTFSSINKLTKVKMNDVLKAYNTLIKAPYKIFIAGDLSIDNVKESFIKHFNKAGKSKKFNIVHKIDKKIKNKIEKNETFSQSFLISLFNVDTTFLSDKKEYYAAILCSMYLHDRLFDVVREKHGLCYAISNTYLSKHGTFRISAGIDASKYRKTISLINKEIKKIQMGKIPNKYWNKTKELTCGLFLSSKDDISNLLSYLDTYSLLDEYVSIDKESEYINQVSKDDVIDIANKMKHITNYLLKGTGTGGDNNE